MSLMPFISYPWKVGVLLLWEALKGNGSLGLPDIREDYEVQIRKKPPIQVKAFFSCLEDEYYLAGIYGSTIRPDMGNENEKLIKSFLWLMELLQLFFQVCCQVIFNTWH